MPAGGMLRPDINSTFNRHSASHPPSQRHLNTRTSSRGARQIHNLRASCQTGLQETYPGHVVCNWLVNSEAIAIKHYLQTTDAHFNAAAGRVDTNLPQHCGNRATYDGNPRTSKPLFCRGLPPPAMKQQVAR